MDDTARKRRQLFVGNTPSIQLLTDLVSDPASAAPPLWIHGPRMCGKECVFDYILESSGNLAIYCNCFIGYNVSQLLTTIYSELVSNNLLPVSYQNIKSCNNIISLVHILQSRLCLDRVLYIVLNGAEKLFGMDQNVCAALFRLDELLEGSTSCIFVSEKSWKQFEQAHSCRHPILIHFPRPSERSLRMELLFLMEKDQELNFFTNAEKKMLLDNLLGVFYPVSLSVADTFQLQKQIIAKLRDADQTKRQLLCQKLLAEAANRLLPLEVSTNSNNRPTAISRRIELPYYGKYMLIASFLASMIPPQYDMKFFSSAGGNSSKKKRKRRSVGGDDLGISPMPFPVERMLAIFYAIIDDVVDDSAEILPIVSTLVSLGLLSAATSGVQLDCIKYRCEATQKTVQEIAQHVGLELQNYLP